LKYGGYADFNDYFTQTKRELEFDLTKDEVMSSHPAIKGYTSTLQNAVPHIINKIFKTDSPLYAVLHGAPSNEIKDKYDHPSFPFSELPATKNHEILFSVQDILLIEAITDLYDPAELIKQQMPAVAPSAKQVLQKLGLMRNDYLFTNAGELAKLQAQVDQANLELVLAEEHSKHNKLNVGPARDKLESALKALQDFYEENLRGENNNERLYAGGEYYAPNQLNSIKTAIGHSLAAEFEAVENFVKTNGDRVIEGYLKYYERIPIGAHLMYQFPAPLGFGALHHSVYIGNKIVVEVLNYIENGALKTFQTATNILSFLKRAVSLTFQSPIAIRNYINPFPPNEIVERALWSLGKFDAYDLQNENCETAASWIVSNKFAAEHVCFVPAKIFAPVQLPEGPVPDEVNRRNGKRTQRNRRRRRARTAKARGRR